MAGGYGDESRDEQATMRARWFIWRHIAKLNVRIMRLNVRCTWLRLKMVWSAAKEEWRDTTIEKVLEE